MMIEQTRREAGFLLEKKMATIQQVKTTFTAGEVSRTLLGRGDLRAYANGALTLRNVFIQPTGGVTRRAGLRYIDTAAGAGRLIAFEFSTEQAYLLVLTDGALAIYADGVLDTTLKAPWTADQIANIASTQSADTLLLVHQDLPPKKLVRLSETVVAVAGLELLSTDAGVIRQPYYKFADVQDTITPSAVTGAITLTASSDVFSSGHVGTRVRVGGKQIQVTAFNSPTVVSGTVVETLAAATATIDWDEQSFSPVHGYPVTVAFHQGRLVIGGSRDLPNRLWFSQSGDLFNFDLGTGLDDEAIEFSVLSDQVNAIRGIFSGRDFQVFTSGAEWMVTGDPLTPTSVQILRQTRIGSDHAVAISRRSTSMARLCLSRAPEDQIEQFLYTATCSRRTRSPTSRWCPAISCRCRSIWITTRRIGCCIWCARTDAFATLTLYSDRRSVEAWTLTPDGGQCALSVAVVGSDVYLMIQRGAVVTIEQIDADLQS